MKVVLAALLSIAVLASAVWDHGSAIAADPQGSAAPAVKAAGSPSAGPPTAPPAYAKSTVAPVKAAEPVKTGPSTGPSAVTGTAPSTKPAGKESSAAPAAAPPPPKVNSPAKETSPAAEKSPQAKPTKWPPSTGSQLKDDDNSCFQCHTNPDAWDPKDKAQYRFFISLDGLKKDAHHQKGVSCVDCHGGDPAVLETKAHQTDDFRSKFADIQKFCAHCHDKPAALLSASPHKLVNCLDCHAHVDVEGKVLPHSISLNMQEKLGDQAAFCGKCHDKQLRELRTSVHAEGKLLACTECHGQPVHGLLPPSNPRSAVALAGQVEHCGGCHAEYQKTFLASVHGQAMVKMGLLVGPGCANCHGAHGIYRPADQRSTIYVTHVADTCGNCHKGIENRLLKSVHGQNGLGGQANRPAPGGTSRQTPTCTSCHSGHEILSPESLAFREGLPDRCGTCHSAMFSLYQMSIHGKLTDLGYGPAAKCYDCHGSHDILALSNPASTLSPENRVKTCSKCHPGASATFATFNPHLNPYDAKKNPLVYFVQISLLTLLFATFAFFGFHSLLWFIRGLVEFLKHGRPRGLKPGETAYVRFVSFHRIGHTIVMSSFLGLALTGLPLKYHEFSWARALAAGMGGFHNTGFWHRFFGVILMTSMLVYLARMVRLLVQGRKKGHSLANLFFGSDSPVPTLRDLKDFLKMLRWFFGLGPRPGFERWSYWEKIDFWGAIADTVIIGTTGLMLWFPNIFCLVLPGIALNVAQVIHSTQALLATGFVFAVHFFNTHLRPDRFPADMSVLTGLVSEEEFKDDRPEYFERLRQDGRLEAMKTTSPGLFVLWSIRLFGFVALSIGMALLVGMLFAWVTQ